MRVLLDENVDSLLKRLFTEDFEVLTVPECSWAGKSNGDLLRMAEQEFDVFVTMDRNLEHQHNLSALDLMVVVLQAHSNAYPVVAPLMSGVNEALREPRAGEVIHITG